MLTRQAKTVACLNHLPVSVLSLRNTNAVHAKASVTEIWLHLSMSVFADLPEIIQGNFYKSPLMCPRRAL